jgi:hypothetical protein
MLLQAQTQTAMPRVVSKQLLSKTLQLHLPHKRYWHYERPCIQVANAPASNETVARAIPDDMQNSCLAYPANLLTDSPHPLTQQVHLSSQAFLACNSRCGFF